MKLLVRDGVPRLDLEDPSLRLTPHQRAALAFDREVVVTAGAGSGKTHTLSLRFVALLLHLAWQAAQDGRRPEVRAVLVLTFTRAAAEEMAERCYQRLQALAEAARAQAEELEGELGTTAARRLVACLGSLLDAFDHAAITTFHAFYAEVLRCFPAATCTPPGFTLLDEDDARALADEVVAAVIEGLSSRSPEVLADLLGTMGSRGRLHQVITALLADRAVLDGVLDRPPRSTAALLAEAALEPEAVAGWLQEVAKPVVDEVVQLTRRRGGPEVPRWADAASRLRDLPADGLELNALYREVLALGVQRGAPRDLAGRAVVGTKKAWGSDQARFDLAVRRLGALSRRLADWPDRQEVALTLPVPADVELERVLGLLTPLAREAASALSTRLSAAGAVDFGEAERRVHAAVTAPQGLAGPLRERHRYVMVDELQDTNATQWRIVAALARAHEDEPEDRVFLVGDAKQAIYRFRGGDVTVTRTAVQALGVTPLELPDNFRSRPELIRWFNGAFAHLLGPPGPERPAWEAPHAPLRPGRAQVGGSVHLLVHDAADAVGVEAEAVARLVAGEILADRGDFQGLALLDRDRHPAPPVAVLLRARAHLRDFQDALTAQGVPTVVGAGVGLWGRPEVVDLVNTLHGLTTGDPTSVVGALRSPLFGLTDHHLRELRLGVWSDGVPALPTFGPPAPLDHDTPQEVRDALAAWESLRARRGRLSPSALVAAVVEETAAVAAWTAASPEGQAEANAALLVAEVARLDGRSPREVAERLLRRVEAGLREREAALTPTSARVVLMTVHASKGLEFPVVIVPRLHATARGPASPVRAGRLDGEPAVAVRVLDPRAPVRRHVGPTAWERMARAEAAEELAESRRLLYVAATRARDHLVLVGARPRGTTPTWMRLLCDWCGDPPQPYEGMRVRSVEEVLPLLSAVTAHAAALPAPSPEEAVRSGPLRSRGEVLVAPSSLDRFQACPAAWMRRYLLRVPEPEVSPDAVRVAAPSPPGVEPEGASSAVTERGSLAAPPRADHGSSQLASLLGQVLHGLLEDDAAHLATVAAVRWQAAVAEAGLVDVAGLGLDRLLRHASRAARDPEVRRRLDAPGWAEVPLRIAQGRVVLQGSIDRLWHDARAGAWTVLDWKSGSPDRERGGAHEHQLRAYAWAADKVLRAHGQAGCDRAELYLTATGELLTLGPWTAAELASVERTLEAIDALAEQPWMAVEASAVNDAIPRPCATCGYRSRGCRGQPT